LARIFIISNRVAIPGAGGNPGGLEVALKATLRKHTCVWLGWSGEVHEKPRTRTITQRNNSYIVTDLKPEDFDEYYNGYANRTLWPLFHYRIDLTEYDRSFDEGYERVNQRFADSLLPLIEPDDLVWVHDYHLLPLGAMLRDKGVTNRIGLFLHIPWPPTRLFVSLPNHESLVASMLQYDLIGFQTEEWLDSFLHYIKKEMGLKVGPGGMIIHGERRIRACSFPIGIDYDEFRKACRSDEAEQGYRRLKESLGGERKMLIGVDRLDYSKGLGERFDSFGRFLTDNPDMAKDVVLLQIAPPSRGDVASYQLIRQDLERKAGHMNGAHADVAWVPIRYVNRGYPRAELAGFYRAADIGLVTPLRDGMNLVAKEYIAAQDEADPGVLILSRFAGAALQLTNAVLVNPHSAEEVSEAIKRALHMPLGERRARHEALMDSVKNEDVLRWRADFVAALQGETLQDGTAQDALPA